MSGHPRSAAQVWDESARPTGPASDPERPHRQDQLATPDRLVLIHDDLRAQLTQLRDLARQVETGATDAGAARGHLATMALRQNSWTLGAYCASSCRVVTAHHGLEDQQLFPALRRADPHLGPVLDRLDEEHHVIHEVIEGVDRALVAMVTGPHSPDRAGGVRAAVELLDDVLASHLAYEERELLAPLARVGLA